MPETFPDFLPTRLVVLSVGINPSLHALRVGYPFAFARNRFWPALNASRLVDAPLTPGRAAIEHLGEARGMGFTDVVKRATPGMRGLTARDYDRDAPRLAALIAARRPALLWFHGKVAAREFLKRAISAEVEPAWGEQAFLVSGARVFVAPNPSPANASYSVADLTAAYDALADLRARLGV